MKIITRKEAKSQGLIRYFTGKPCGKGHICERRVSGAHCIKCRKDYEKEYRKIHKNETVTYHKTYYKIHKKELGKQHKEYISKYRTDNKDKLIEYGIEYREKNQEKVKQSRADWAKNNPEKRATTEAKRRAAKLHATPIWYESEKEFIEFVYKCRQELSNSTGVQHDVDHIIPLQGKNVCGLHCIANLQIITQTENCKKSNKFEVK